MKAAGKTQVVVLPAAFLLGFVSNGAGILLPDFSGHNSLKMI